jgi:ribosomal protein L5
MVRGEKMIELIELLVEFVITHVHPFPGLPPVSVGTSGVQTQEILNKIRNASNEILNQNIRIN